MKILYNVGVQSQSINEDMPFPFQHVLYESKCKMATKETIETL